MEIMGFAIRLKFHKAHLTPSKLHSLAHTTLPIKGNPLSSEGILGGSSIQPSALCV